MFQKVEKQHDRILVIGGGESLIGFDMSQIMDFDGVVMTVNNVVYHIPRCDYWMTVDPMNKDGQPQRAMLERKDGVEYWCAYPDLEKTPHDSPYYQTVEGINYIERIVPYKPEGAEKGDFALQEERDKITTGDSIYGCLGMCYHMGAKEIVMLGVDGYGYGHWYDTSDPYNANNKPDFKEKYLDRIPKIYRDCVWQFDQRGTKIVNGSPDSVVDCFERMKPEDAIKYFS